MPGPGAGSALAALSAAIMRGQTGGMKGRMEGQLQARQMEQQNLAQVLQLAAQARTPEQLGLAQAYARQMGVQMPDVLRGDLAPRPEFNQAHAVAAPEPVPATAPEQALADMRGPSDEQIAALRRAAGQIPAQDTHGYGPLWPTGPTTGIFHPEAESTVARQRRYLDAADEMERQQHMMEMRRRDMLSREQPPDGTDLYRMRFAQSGETQEHMAPLARALEQQRQREIDAEERKFGLDERRVEVAEDQLGLEVDWKRYLKSMGYPYRPIPNNYFRGAGGEKRTDWTAIYKAALERGDIETATNAAVRMEIVAGGVPDYNRISNTVKATVADQEAAKAGVLGKTWATLTPQEKREQKDLTRKRKARQRQHEKDMADPMLQISTRKKDAKVADYEKGQRQDEKEQAEFDARVKVRQDKLRRKNALDKLDTEWTSKAFAHFLGLAQPGDAGDWGRLLDDINRIIEMQGSDAGFPLSEDEDFRYADLRNLLSTDSDRPKARKMIQDVMNRMNRLTAGVR